MIGDINGSYSLPRLLVGFSIIVVIVGAATIAICHFFIGNDKQRLTFDLDK